jgi:hypothetical protein
MRRHRSILGVLAAVSLLAACGGAGEDPVAPPIPDHTENPLKADGTCTYACAQYHFAANQCFQGWQCDAQGACLSYVGTPDAPNACPAPPPPPPPCIPTTCAAQHASCGTIDDTCGGTLNCGVCVNNDPFDPASCPGATLSYQQMVGLLAGGTTSRTLATNYPIKRRVRTCSSATGCTGWHSSSDVPDTSGYYATSAAINVLWSGQAELDLKIDHCTGDLPYSSPDHASCGLQPGLACVGFECGWGGINHLSGRFTGTLTSSCLRLQSDYSNRGEWSTTWTEESWAFVVRF